MSNDLLTRIAEVERLEKEWLAADQLHDRLARISTDRADTQEALRRCGKTFLAWEEAQAALLPDLVTAYRALLAASTAQQERIKRLEGELAAAVSKLSEIRETCVGEEHFIACEILSIIEKE